MSIYKKILVFFILATVCIIGGSIMLFNSTFGNYNSTVYSLFINPFLWTLYIIFSIILIQITKRIGNKKLYFLFILPIIFVFISYLNGKNIHKNILLEGGIEDFSSSSISLFDNQTFEIRIQHPHVAEYKKGKFVKNGNKINLLDSELSRITDSLYTKQYELKNDSVLAPIEKNFKIITVYNTVYKQ